MREDSLQSGLGEGFQGQRATPPLPQAALRRHESLAQRAEQKQRPDLILA